MNKVFLQKAVGLDYQGLKQRGAKVGIIADAEGGDLFPRRVGWAYACTFRPPSAHTNTEEIKVTSPTKEEVSP